MSAGYAKSVNNVASLFWVFLNVKESLPDQKSDALRWSKSLMYFGPMSLRKFYIKTL